MTLVSILFALRVMFRVHVYLPGSDTYPVFRTRFSPTPAHGSRDNFRVTTRCIASGDIFYDSMISVAISVRISTI